MEGTSSQGGENMTTAEERKARREERLLKEEKRRLLMMSLWTGIRFLLAILAMVAVSGWLAVVMWDHVEWAMTISWAAASVVIGAALLWKAGK